MIKLVDCENNNIVISWKTILVGRKLKLANSSFMKDFASQYLSEHYKLDNMNIIELAYGEKDEFEIDEKLQKILEELKQDIDENSEEWNVEKRKWRFLLLQALLNQSYSNRKILDEIESIYCDFDHPEEMNAFLIYMPHVYDDGYNVKDHSAEENIAHIVKWFKDFLLNEHKELSKQN